MANTTAKQEPEYELTELNEDDAFQSLEDLEELEPVSMDEEETNPTDE